VDKNKELGGMSAEAVVNNDIQNISKWCIDLRYMPIFTDKQLNEKLINNAETMPDTIAPNVYRDIIVACLNDAWLQIVEERTCFKC